MRVTIHLVAKRDFWPFALATRPARRELWLRAMREGATAGSCEELAALRARAPRRRTARSAARSSTRSSESRTRSASGSVVDLVRVPPSGTWERRRADLFALAEDWVGPPPDMTADEAARAARAQLPRRLRPGVARRHRLLHRPVARASSRRPASACGCARSAARAATSCSTSRARRCPIPTSPSAVRFLPTWDATLLVHARRARILPEEHRAKIFHVRNPHSDAVFLVDGAVAGTWKLPRRRGSSCEPVRAARPRDAARAARAGRPARGFHA